MISQTFVRYLAAALLAAGQAAPAPAQTRTPSLPVNSPFLGGVPDPPAAGPLQLSIAETIRRALDHNLGVLEAEERIGLAEGARRIALSWVRNGARETPARSAWAHGRGRS